MSFYLYEIQTIYSLPICVLLVNVLYYINAFHLCVFNVMKMGTTCHSLNVYTTAHNNLKRLSICL